MANLSDDQRVALQRQFAHARELHMAGRQQQAGQIYQQILAVDPEHADTLHLTGVLWLQRKQYPRAIELIEQAIAIRPGRAKYHSNLGNALRDNGQYQAALASYRDAIEMDPLFIDAQQNLGKAYIDAGDAEAARACFERALNIDPSFAPSLDGLAAVLQQQGKLDQALDAHRRAIKLDPSRTEFRINMAMNLLRNGAAADALDICNSCLAARQQTVRSLAIKAIALAELDRGAAAHALMDLDQLVETVMVETPASYDSLTAFNHDLADHIVAHPSLMRSPPDNATRFGWHTGELVHDDHRAIGALKTLLINMVDRRLAGAPSDSTHPFWAAKPARYKLNLWGVVMESQGHQVPHIHPSAWMGGVYYAELPPEVDDPAKTPAGWIEFGRGDDGLYRHTEPRTRMVKPVEGLLVTFPSFFWHRTVPFQSSRRRISAAFDVVEAAAAPT
jgi:Flp pilus assembly protein TadD